MTNDMPDFEVSEETIVQLIEDEARENAELASQRRWAHLAENEPKHEGRKI